MALTGSTVSPVWYNEKGLSEELEDTSPGFYQ